MTNSLKLLDLPNETLRSILVFLSQAEIDRSGLANAARTCRRLQVLVEPVLYDTIRLLRSQHGTEAFVDAMRNNTMRLSLVRDVVWLQGESELFHRELSRFVLSMSLLRRLHLAFSQEVDLKLLYQTFETSSLLNPHPSLRTLLSLQDCCLHFRTFVGTSLEELFPILLHPTLRTLTLTGFVVDLSPSTRTLLGTYAHTTALTWLILEQNAAVSSSVSIIISIPRALRRLRTAYDHDPLPLILDSQLHSLQSLSLYQVDYDYADSIFVIPFDLSHMVNVLELEWTWEHMWDSGFADGIDCGDHERHMRMLRGLPPRLLTLRFSSVEFSPEFARYINYLRCIGSNLQGHGLQGLKRMIFEFFVSCDISDTDEEREALSNLIPELESLVTMYKDNGVRLMVWAWGGKAHGEALETWSFDSLRIPPIVEGEPGDDWHSHIGLLAH